MPDSTRRFDVVLLGATGFTGGLTAEYLAGRLPAGARWALAGRSRDKLEAVRTRLGVAPEREPDLLPADVTDRGSLREVAESSRVVISAVGPYMRYGEPVVAACAEAGTDYVDLAGEPEFVDRMYLAHHGTAVRTGARLVHSCGFESVPHDLGALFTVRQLPSGVPLTVRGVVRSGAGVSTGTFASVLEQMSRSRQAKQVSAERRRAEPRAEDGRRARARGSAVRRDRVLGYWLVPLPTIDPVVVGRSAATHPDYGPDFTYSHFAGFKRLRSATASAIGVAGLFVAAHVAPVRNRLLGRAGAGEGPTADRRATSWFTVELVGEGGGRRVVTKVHGGDPGYTESAKMLAESALCLAFDHNPETAGQVTTAVAMGDSLLARLSDSGIPVTLEASALLE